MMHINSETIDQIVRNVMRDMQPRTTSTSLAAPVRIPAPDSSEAIVQIDSKVITEEVLNAARAAGRIIAINPDAVVTPSARDYIRRNAVQLTSRMVGSVTATSGLLIGIGASSLAFSAAAAADWKTLAVSTEREAAAITAQHITTGLVTCIGGEPSVVACLLNRNQAVRAAVVTRVTNLVTLAALMNPQVVCLEASGWSFGELLKVFRSLAATRTAPVDWQEMADGGVR